METGLVIGGHYLLQRLIQQGQYCAVYQGVDQLFQRPVAVKSVPAAHVPVYRAAVRMTSQFSYPNIVGLYDLASKPDRFYLVQEYVEGDDFATILQAQLQPYEVADFGYQICSALRYASSSSRRICHGDLTPDAIFRDRRGVIRVNNFALPSDLPYFTAWSTLGGEGAPISDRDLPWGLISEGRLADDIRAVGLLLYQLLTGRAPGTTPVVPPPDGRLRFPRNVPPELCELVARTVIRQHPQRIASIEVLNDELRILAEAPEAPVPVLVHSPVLQRGDTLVKAQQLSPTPAGTGNPGQSPPGVQGQPGVAVPIYRGEHNARLAAMERELSPSALTIADTSIKPVTARPTIYPHVEEKIQPAQRSSLLWLLLLGLILFALFFVIGYFAGHFFIPGH